MNDTQLTMFNFVTRTYEDAPDDLKAISDEQARAYFPQLPPALAIYDIHRQRNGMTPYEAMFAVMQAFCEKDAS